MKRKGIVDVLVLLGVIFAGLMVPIGIAQVKSSYDNSPVINVTPSENKMIIDASCGKNHTLKEIPINEVK